MRKTKVVAIRFTQEECERLERVVSRAKERSLGYATEADVLRELIGFRPMKAVTEDDRAIISGIKHAKVRASP